MVEPNATIKNSSPIVEDFTVSNLFGAVDYHFSLGSGDKNAYLKLFYGENGAGKTTVLNLIYHSLSKVRGEGSLTALAATPFKHLEIRLSDGRAVRLEKTEELVGSFNVAIEIKGKISQHKVSVNSENAVLTSPETTALYAAIRELDIDLFYLTDNRQYRTTFAETKRHHPTEESDITVRSDGTVVRRQSSRPTYQYDVGAMARIARSIFQDRILLEGNFGQQNADTIYLNLARAMVVKSRPSKSDAISKTAALDRIDKFARSVRTAVSYDIFPAIRFDDYKTLIRDATDEQFTAMNSILIPYFRGLEARLAAINDRIAKIDLFLHEINSLYKNKRVDFSISKGFRIVGWRDKLLPFEALSSGERQLFMLLICTFLIGKDGGVFIVDEPELSLNVKWQRVIIDTLLKLGAGTNLQYLIATHSLEILSGQKERIITLQPS